MAKEGQTGKGMSMDNPKWTRGIPTEVGSYWVCYPDQSGNLYVDGPASIYRKLGGRGNELLGLAHGPADGPDHKKLREELEALPLWITFGNHDGPLSNFWPCEAYAPYTRPDVPDLKALGPAGSCALDLREDSC